MSLMQFIVATAVGLSTTFAVGTILQNVVNRQREVSSIVSNVTGWNEVVANILSPKSVARLTQSLSPAINACMAGVGQNCTTLNSAVETPVDLSILQLRPFFGVSAGCLSVSDSCPMERRLSQRLVCESPRSCTLVMHLAMWDHSMALKGKAPTATLIKDRRFPLSNAIPPVANLNFQGCVGKPIGIDYPNSRVICATQRPITCNGLSVIGVGEGQCGEPTVASGNGLCQLTVDPSNPESLNFNYQTDGPHRFVYTCEVTGAVNRQESGVVYGSASQDPQHQGREQILSQTEVARGRNTTGGLSVRCVGRVLDDNRQTLGSCETQASVGPPLTPVAGPAPPPTGSGRSSTSLPALVSGNGSGFTSSLGASF